LWIIDAPRRDGALKEALNREARVRRTAGHLDALAVRCLIRTAVENQRPAQG